MKGDLFFQSHDRNFSLSLPYINRIESFSFISVNVTFLFWQLLRIKKMFFKLFILYVGPTENNFFSIKTESCKVMGLYLVKKWQVVAKLQGPRTRYYNIIHKRGVYKLLFIKTRTITSWNSKPFCIQDGFSIKIK